jgi:hypothetical protein
MEELRTMGLMPWTQGNKVGVIEEIFLDKDTQEPEWIGRHAWSKHVFVPVEGAAKTHKGLRIPLTRKIKSRRPTGGCRRNWQGREGANLRSFGL